jgi:ABC-type multidrug transport system fused ATPase/permease subunit
MAAILEVAGLAIWYPVVMMVAYPDPVAIAGRLAWLASLIGTDDPRALVLAALGGAIVVSLLVAVVRIAATLVSARIAFAERTSFSVRLLQAYLVQPYEWMVERNTADLTREVVEEVPKLVETCLTALSQLYFACFLSGTLFLGMIYTDPWIALSSLAILGIMFGLVYRFVRTRIAAVAGREFEHTNQVSRRVVEAIFAVREARVPPHVGDFVGQMTREQRALADIASGRELLGDIPGKATEVTARIGILLAILYLLFAGHPHAIALAGVYVMVVIRVAPEVRNIFTQASALHTTVPLLIHFREFLDSERETLESCTEVISLEDAIRLEGVRYSYPAREGDVVRGVDLEVPRRTSLALVGETGAGKSTLAAILAGLLVPREGSLRVDGEVLDEEGRQAWRNNVGYVSQDVYMIQSTIRGNIALGIPEDEVDEDRVHAAAEAAGAMEFISQFEYGVGHWLQERGASLSGGQRQRIALARALYHDPEVLVLDEATSALDNRTERVVLEALERLGEKKTLVVIAHRLTTVRNCDQVCLVEDGEVVARGSFEELVATSPRFAEMVEAGTLQGPEAVDPEVAQSSAI